MLDRNSTYALIDRLRLLQKRKRHIGWIPFTKARVAAIDAEIRTVQSILLPPVLPSPRLMAEWDARLEAESHGVGFRQYNEGARQAKWIEYQARA